MSTALTVIPPEEYLRERFIGGADIPGVLGVSDFGDTPVSVYLRKRREPGPQPAPKRETQLMRRGKLWEKVVGEMLVEELERRGYRCEIVNANRRYQDPAVPFFAAEIDYELRLDGKPDIVNCELKTVTPFAASRWPPSDLEDAAPTGYTAQVYHGLGVTDRNFGILAALFGADELRVYPVHRDEEIVQGIRSIAFDLWTNNIVPGVPPPVRTATDCDRLFKIGNGQKLIADEALTAKALRLRTLYAQIDAAEAEFAQLEFDLKRAMGECESLSVNDDNAVTWKNRKLSIFEEARFKADNPKLHKQYVREGTTRAFSVLKGWRA